MSKSPYRADFNKIKRSLTNKILNEMEEDHNIKLPRYCRHVIRNGMAIEAGARLVDEQTNERIESIVSPLSRFVEALDDEAKHEFSVRHHLDIRLAKLRWLGDPKLTGLDLLLDKLTYIQRELVASLPTPTADQKAKKWIRDLQEKCGQAEIRPRQRPRKDRGRLYSELAWVWCEVGQALIAKKNPTVRFVRFVEAVTKRLPDLKLHTNLNVDIKRWYKEYQPLTPSEREANDRLAEAYRQGELKFRVLPLLSDGAAPRLRYDASRPHP
jgi:hypothetical protein